MPRARSTGAKRRSLRIRSGDHVKVIAGKDRGKTGRVLRVEPAKERVYVEHLNMIKRHMRPQTVRDMVPPGHAVVPASDDLGLAQREGERLAPVPGGIELLPVGPRVTDVLDGHGVALFRCRAAAGRQFFNLQFRFCHAGFSPRCAGASTQPF